MAKMYAVDAAACYVFPAMGAAYLAYRGAPFPADATNLDTVLESGMVIEVPSDAALGGLPADVPDAALLPELAPVEKPGPRQSSTKSTS